MFNDIIYTIALYIFFITLLLNSNMFYAANYDAVINIDYIIIQLRKRFKKMVDDNRFTMDICNNSDKIGSNREYIKLGVGNNCEPWISRECIYVLDHILPYNAIGLEWSSGSSTLWLSYRLKSLISIENNEKWSKMVKNILYRRRLHNITKLMWIDKDDINYCKEDKQYISKFYTTDTCFKSYVTTKLIPYINYDFINIDGRARTGCLIRAIKMVKKENGIIIVDNAERERYRWSYNSIPSRWTKHDFWYSTNLVRMFISH